MRCQEVTMIALALVSVGCKKGHKLEVGPVATSLGPTKDVTFGMTSKEFEKTHPDFDYRSDEFESDYDVEGKWNLISRVDLADERVRRIRQEIQHHEFLDTIEKAWGAGLDTTVGITKQSVKRYYNESAGTRADISHEFFSLEVVPYKPLAKQLDGPDPYSVMGVQILGRPAKDVIADFEKQHDYALTKDVPAGSALIMLPTDEWLDTNNVLDLELDKSGLVTAYRISLADRPDEAQAKPIAALLQKKWGAGRVVEHEGTAYGTQPGALFTDHGLLKVAAHPDW